MNIIGHDLSIDDIHNIREEHSKNTSKMTFEELKEYYDNIENKFYSEKGKMLIS